MAEAETGIVPTRPDAQAAPSVVAPFFDTENEKAAVQPSIDESQFSPVVERPIHEPVSARNDENRRQQEQPSQSMSSFSFADSAYGTATSTSFDTELSDYSRESSAAMLPLKGGLKEEEVPSSTAIQAPQWDESAGRDYLTKYDDSSLTMGEESVVVFDQKAPVEVGHTMELISEPEVRQYGAVSLPSSEADDDFWVQPRQEYRPPDNWEASRPRSMWTTVFSDEGETAEEPHEEDRGGEAYGRAADDNAFIPTSMSSEATVAQKTTGIQEELPQRFSGVARDDSLDDSPHVIQMDDPTSPTIFTSSATPKALPTGATATTAPSTPAITVTVYEDKKGTTGDEDSEGESSSSDEDDYPDQIIEAPSAPMSFAALEQEREAQSAFAAEVLQQIQSFGEAANDEFDVQWATSATKEALPDHRETVSTTTSQVENISPFVADSTSTPSTSDQQTSSGPLTDDKPNVASMEAKTQQRINPFLDSPEEEELDGVVVEQVSLDSDDIDYAQAEKYYKQYFQVHRPGPVYTIPEGEEEEGVPKS
ncbi:hypothetical protein AAVH_02720 [Aphelenchoides avenae]|nr:hypothetical protein AAVH_02720 [Aphelenchus avenae]